MAEPTIRDVAALAGVSVATVSRVISGTVPVAPETQARVTEAMERLGWRPNMAARSLVRGSTGLYGVIVPDVANPFFGELAQGMSLAASQLGIQLLLLHTDLSSERDAAALQLCREHRVDAVIYTSGPLGPELQEELDRLGRPVALAATFDPLGKRPGFLVDSLLGGRLGAQHLLQLGHKRIALVGGPASDPVAAGPRWQGWREELSAAGLLPPLAWQLEVGWKQQHGYQAGISLLRSADRPTAILCGSDVLALGVLAAAADLGIAVPQGLSVVGFDNLAWASLWRPSLTTVAQPMGQIGQEAVRLAHTMATDGASAGGAAVGAAGAVTTWLIPELTIRGSSGPPPVL